MSPSLDAPAEFSSARRTMRACLAFAGGLLSAPGAPAEDAALLADARATLAALSGRGVPFPAADPQHAPLAHLRRLLAPHVLFQVHINPEMRVRVVRGDAEPLLTAGEWRYFLARVENESGTTAPLRAESAQRVGWPAAAPDAWLELELLDETATPLSGRPVEYRVVALRTSALGRREARFALHVGQGTQDLGFRNEVDVLFLCTAPPR